MKNAFDPSVAAEAPPLPGYRPIAYFRLDMQRIGIAGFLLALPLALLSLVAVALLGGPGIWQVSAAGWQDWLLAFLTSTIILPIIHEAVHGIFALLCGARPSFGVGPGYAYATFQKPVSKLQYLLIGLAPLILLSPLSFWLVLVSPSLAGQAFIFYLSNTAGAIGDLWVAWKTLPLPENVRIRDLRDGFAAYLPE